MLSLLAGVPSAITSGAECDKTASSAETIVMKWNAYASEWGMYEIDGCTGVSPKLKLSAGIVYTFDQSDASNWCIRNCNVLSRSLACR